MLKKGISGATLKWIAIGCMLIDHIGATIILNLYYASPTWPMYYTYRVFRDIGRLAFPIFCFLLVEGFRKTHNRTKYLRNLLIFTAVSEIPFDLAFNNGDFGWGSMNVFATLAIGLLAIWAYEESKKVLSNVMLQGFSCGFITFFAVQLANFLGTDYHGIGILVIMAMHLLYDYKVAAMIVGCVILAYLNKTELFALVDSVFVGLYNGERGKQNKYFFYVFYPVHLILLALLARFIA